VPVNGKVLVAAPSLFNPFLDASEITVAGKDKGQITRAAGGGSFGEGVRRVRDKEGEVAELWLAGSKLLPEAEVAKEMRERYEAGAARRGTIRRLKVAAKRS
jgi:hypothetical protein